MARIRTIKPKFWDDSKLAKISRDARLVFIGMWNFSDDLGVIMADPVWIKSKLFPYDNIQIQQFGKWLLELRQAGFISPFSLNGEEFYYLPNLLRHQVINRPNYDDVYVPKSILERLLKDSVINHGTITAGKEGIGEESKGKDRSMGFSPPSLDEVKTYVSERNCIPEVADKFFSYYDAAGWKDSNGKQVKSWKQKFISVWEKDEVKQKPERKSHLPEHLQGAKNKW